MRRLNDLLAFEIGVSRLILVGALVGTLLLAGCASADPPTMSKNGCTVDLRKVCQYILDNNWLVSSSDGNDPRQATDAKHVGTTRRGLRQLLQRCATALHDRQSDRTRD